MKKLIKIWLILILALAFIPAPSSFADEVSGKAKKTNTASDAAANAASSASAGGINTTLIEAGIFCSAIALMAVSIGSGSGEPNTQPTAHGHGH